jgi:hypothetical protein
MTLNEKKLNYKVVDLIKSYNFCLKFISICVHIKKLRFFENRLTLTAMGHNGYNVATPNRRGPRRFAPTAMGHDGSRLVLLNFETVVYFCKVNKKINLKNKSLARRRRLQRDETNPTRWGLAVAVSGRSGTTN